uniref:Uncharacterized protein n=1 Tax=Zea mays TaxID=4577 RepID=B7ZZH9_MAIZE|nr:unknown [Zea mays]
MQKSAKTKDEMAGRVATSRCLWDFSKRLRSRGHPPLRRRRARRREMRWGTRTLPRASRMMAVARDAKGRRPAAASWDGDASRARLRNPSEMRFGFPRKRSEPRFWRRVGGRLLIQARRGEAAGEAGRLVAASASGGQNPPKSSTKRALCIYRSITTGPLHSLAR